MSFTSRAARCTGAERSGFELSNRWHSWWHSSITVGPTRSHSVTGRNVSVTTLDPATLAMDADRARLSATNRPAAFRIENLESWACLDDGDISANARHETLSGPALQAWIQRRVATTKIWNHRAHRGVVLDQKPLRDRIICFAQDVSGAVGGECHQQLNLSRTRAGCRWSTTQSVHGLDVTGHRAAAGAFRLSATASAAIACLTPSALLLFPGNSRDRP